MAKKDKGKSTRKMPAVCLAIRAVRAKTGKSQEVFAQEIEIASMTLSRYERGVVPRDRAVLGRLRAVAADAGCVIEEQVFYDALMALPGGPSRFEPTVMVPAFTPLQWRLMQAARIAMNFFPDVARAMEEAARPALDLVDEIMAEAAAGDRRVSVQFYANLETKLDELAARKIFQIKRESAQ
jgi:transcriptional regulator with XRE-family HTH domain